MMAKAPAAAARTPFALISFIPLDLVVLGVDALADVVCVTEFTDAETAAQLDW